MTLTSRAIGAVVREVVQLPAERVDVQGHLGRTPRRRDRARAPRVVRSVEPPANRDAHPRLEPQWEVRQVPTGSGRQGRAVQRQHRVLGPRDRADHQRRRVGVGAAAVEECERPALEPA